MLGDKGAGHVTLRRINTNLRVATHGPCPADLSLAPCAAVKYNPEENSSGHFSESIVELDEAPGTLSLQLVLSERALGIPKFGTRIVSALGDL